jgi:rhamnosyltransferase
LNTKSDFLFEGAGQGCTYVVTGNFYRRLRAFFTQQVSQTELLHYHDWAIYALSRSWQAHWIFDQEPMMRYRQHGGNDTGARASLGGIIRRLCLIKSGWYMRQMRVIAQLCLAADSSNSTIVEWNELLSLPTGLIRRYRIARFCMQGGRRRRSDNMVLLIAAIAGWV